MKKLSRFNKFIFICNFFVLLVTFVAYFLPFLAPRLFPILSVLSLFLPLILIINLLFFIYWFLQFKRQMLLSGIVLLLGITFINKFYKLYGNEAESDKSDLVIMSYNVRLFNLYDWIKNEDVSANISEFIKENNPDVLCIQEFSNTNTIDFSKYPYQHIFIEGKNTKLGQAIFSKFPIVDRGVLNFPNSTNNAVFVDLRKDTTVFRVYSIHLQSIKITPDVHEIDENIQEGVTKSRSKRIFARTSAAFREQQNQAEIVKKHKMGCSYPVIICGDMNNSAFSFVYRSVKGDLKDTFEEAGSGFGKTYSFKYYPARIDYIFTDKQFEVKSHKSFSDFKNSDHFPIVSRVSIMPKVN